MKITAEYKGRQVTFDVPDEALDKLIEEPKKTGWENPEVGGQRYWYVDHQGQAQPSCWSNEPIDHRRYSIGNCFTSKELAENIARYQSLDLRIRRRITEICEPVDWNTHNSAKWTIIYDHPHKMLYVDCYYNQHFGQWNCDTREHAKQIIEEFKDDLLWYFTEFKDRMDG